MLTLFTGMALLCLAVTIPSEMQRDDKVRQHKRKSKKTGRAKCEERNKVRNRLKVGWKSKEGEAED